MRLPGNNVLRTSERIKTASKVEMDQILIRINQL